MLHTNFSQGHAFTIALVSPVSHSQHVTPQTGACRGSIIYAVLECFVDAYVHVTDRNIYQREDAYLSALCTALDQVNIFLQNNAVLCFDDGGGLVWFGLFVHPFSHICNTGHVNYRLQFTM